MRAKGYTQRDVLQADVQKAYVEGIGNMTINGSGGSTTGDMLGIGIGLAAAGHIAPKIGDMFGGRDHTTVKYACGKIEDEINQDKNFAEIINSLKKEIRD